MTRIPNRGALALLAALLVAALASCGGTSAVPGGNGTPAPTGGSLHLPDPVSGLRMPTAPAADINFDDSAKSPSAVYRILFRDSVNQSSGGRWLNVDGGGQKKWELSNTFFSAPKAWVVGQNYWNHEDQEILGNQFGVADGEDGLALTFTARWNIAPGDFGTVYFITGLGSFQVDAFTGGQNPSYPGWDKYYYKLPKNTSGLPQNCSVAFRLTSDAAGTAWGFGVDNVAVYQTQLGTPINVVASEDAGAGLVHVDWDHNNQGNLVPDGYDVYRAPDNGGAPGTYSFLGNVAYPIQTLSDNNGSADTYWYKVVAVKDGWPDSADSNEDSGYGAGTWLTIQVDSDDVAYTSLADINGHPAIAYYDPTPNNELHYAYSDADGNGPWHEVVVDNTGDVGQLCSLALVDGKPAIAYFDATNNDLKYAFSLQPDGSSGWNTLTVDSPGSVGPYASLAVVDGFPAISYNDATGDLKYAYSSQADGSSGWTAILVEAVDLVGYDTSLRVINGFPGISHGDATGAGALHFAYSTQVDGHSSWSSAVVDNTAQGFYTSLAMVNGFPGISYGSGLFGPLKYAYSTLADGSGGWNSVAVDTSGMYTGLAVWHGTPIIGYYYPGTGDLRVATTTQPDGSSGWLPTFVDGLLNNVGEYASLALVNGKPAISYRDQTDTQLKFAWLQ